ncbi:hypothetical protein OG588_18960 [Streptomyces prunicolor]|uniref:hypothetical protein n=1 Tax=Streptomyces prunicolor TaxID=67348 RepID=UPI003865B290|nr:hypothetical protein OG588_18960 [Streptomyces prunicolor]
MPGSAPVEDTSGGASAAATADGATADPILYAVAWKEVARMLRLLKFLIIIAALGVLVGMCSGHS